MKDDHLREIPEHESAVRRVWSEKYGLEYSPLKNFEEAKKYADAYMIMEGDWGGQIYLSIPVKQIKCSYDVLENLLREIDAREWGRNEGEGAGIYFERKINEKGIVGGMGGGAVLDSLWVHDELLELGDKILDVLNGNKKSILE